MRVTIRLDEQILRAAKKLAADTNRTLTAVITDALRAALLSDEERKALQAAIDESLRQAASGRTRPASEIIDEIRRRGKP